VVILQIDVDRVATIPAEGFVLSRSGLTTLLLTNVRQFGGISLRDLFQDLSDLQLG